MSRAAVDITATLPVHHTAGLTCLAAGKHAIIQKPLAVSVKAGRLLVEEADRRGTALHVVHAWTLAPYYVYSLPAAPETGVAPPARVLALGDPEVSDPEYPRLGHAADELGAIDTPALVVDRVRRRRRAQVVGDALAQRLRHRRGGRERRVVRCRRPHDLDQRHHRDGVEEVEADDPLGVGDVGSHLRDGQRGRVRREHALR